MRILNTALATLGALTVGILAGPRVSTETTSEPPEVPALTELDRHLSDTESALGDVTPGTEKRIIWADGVGRPTTYALVYLHGFSGTSQEIAPVPDSLARRIGANLYYSRLRGHGRDGEALANVSLRDWTEDVSEAIAIGEQLADRVVLMGTSNGGALAAWAAAQPDLHSRLAALVLVSPNFGPADPRSRMLLWPWGGALAEMVVGPVREWEPYNEEHGRYSTQRYPTRALLPMMATVRALERADLAQIPVPTLIAYSSKDQVVSVEAMRKAESRFSPGRIRYADMGETGDPVDHLIGGRILSPESTGRLTTVILDFLSDAGISG